VKNAKMSLKAKVEEKLKKTERMYDKTYFRRHQHSLVAISTRTAELSDSLEEMWVLLRRLPEEKISGAESRKMLRQLRHIIQLSQKYRELESLNASALNSSRLDLEAEYASFRMMVDRLSSAVRWAESASGGL
jgi:hypothetical protein